MNHLLLTKYIHLPLYHLFQKCSYEMHNHEVWMHYNVVFISQILCFFVICYYYKNKQL